jgi:hypothetical protein
MPRKKTTVKKSKQKSSKPKSTKSKTANKLQPPTFALNIPDTKNIPNISPKNGMKAPLITMERVKFTALQEYLTKNYHLTNSASNPPPIPAPIDEGYDEYSDLPESPINPFVTTSKGTLSIALSTPITVGETGADSAAEYEDGKKSGDAGTTIDSGPLSNQQLHTLFSQQLLNNLMQSYLAGIIIAKQGGDALFMKHLQGELNFNLIANFLAALNMFGEENLGEIHRILIQGKTMDLNVLQKHGLIFTAIFLPRKVTDHFTIEGEIALDKFYEQFKEPIMKCRSNQNIYLKFESTLMDLIRQYLKRISKK